MRGRNTSQSGTNLAADHALAEAKFAHELGEGRGRVWDLEDLNQCEHDDPDEPDARLGLIVCEEGVGAVGEPAKRRSRAES
jgi:hypothetical protein